MIIIGCDFHTRYQQIAMAREETGEVLLERRLDHESGEAQAFYRSLRSSQEPVRVGIEATGPIHWFERLLAELGHELRIGDSAKIRASEVRKQKTDERDARLILDLMLAHRFPEIWVPTPAERDLRQLLRQRLTSETLWKTFSGVGRGLVPNPFPASIWDHFLSCSSLSAVYRCFSTPALFLF